MLNENVRQASSITKFILIRIKIFNWQYIILTVYLMKCYSLHENVYSPYCSLYIFCGTDKENIAKTQELFKSENVSFIFMNSMTDSVVIPW